jgi:hypothetical protein
MSSGGIFKQPIPDDTSYDSENQKTPDYQQHHFRECLCRTSSILLAVAFGLVILGVALGLGLGVGLTRHDEKNGTGLSER